MHPSDEKLIGFLTGPGDGDTRRHLEAGCERCSPRIEQFRLLLASMRSDRDAEPPAAWTAAAVRLRAAPRAGARLAEGLRRWSRGLAEELARVVSDSGLAGTPALAGIRSGAVARRLRFESDDVELDLQIETGGGDTTLTGQFLSGDGPEPLAGLPLLIETAGDDLVEGATDAFGEFCIELPRRALRIHARRTGRILRFDLPLDSEAS